MKKVKFLKNKTFLLAALLMIGICRFAYAQHHAPATQAANNQKEAFNAGDIMTQALNDPELKGFLYEARILELAPGFIDTVDHRHDADLFVFVLEGSVETQLENNAPETYTKGQMFYEYPNVLHTNLKNLSATEPAKLMLNFIIKEGRQPYRTEHPAGHTNKE